MKMTEARQEEVNEMHNTCCREAALAGNSDRYAWFELYKRITMAEAMEVAFEWSFNPPHPGHVPVSRAGTVATFEDGSSLDMREYEEPETGTCGGFVTATMGVMIDRMANRDRHPVPPVPAHLRPAFGVWHA